MEHVAEIPKQHQHGAPVFGHSRDATPTASPLPPVFQLQQQAGNQAVQQLLRSGYIQAKLAISNPDDPEEREADSVAHTIMRKAAGAPSSTPCSCSHDGEMCEECQQKQSQPTIHRRASAPSAPAHVPRIVSDVLRSPGHPLDAATRAFFEPRFGHDFSHVRIHADSAASESARSINAHAFTAGNDIAFASGQYAPDTSQGRTLIAHELVHIMQQGIPSLDCTIVQRQPVPAGGGGGGFDPRCLEILGRILSFLYGGANHTLGTVGVIGPAIHRGVIERVAQLLADPRNLYTNHRTLAQADPVYGSWEGHQLALEGQQRGLRRALDEWRTFCGGPDGGGGVPPEAANVVRTANVWATRPVPDRPLRVPGPQAAPDQRYTLVLPHAGGSNLTRDQAAAAINEELIWATNRVDRISGEHDLLRKNREEHYIVGWAADVAGGVDLPPMSIWDDPRAKLAATRAAVGAKNIDGAMTSFAEFEKAFAPARQRYLTYKEGTIGGAETVKIGAEVVAVAAAVVFVVAGGALVLGAGAGAGAGTSAVVGTAATTGAVGTTATTTTVTVIAASDSVAASSVLSTALAASAEVTVPAELLTAAAEAAPWIAEDAEFMSMMK